MKATCVLLLSLCCMLGLVVAFGYGDDYGYSGLGHGDLGYGDPGYGGYRYGDPGYSDPGYDGYGYGDGFDPGFGEERESGLIEEIFKQIFTRRVLMPLAFSLFSTIGTAVLPMSTN